MSVRVVTIEVDIEEAIRLKDKGFKAPEKLKLQQPIENSFSFTIYKLHGVDSVFGIKFFDGYSVELIEIEEDDRHGISLNILPYLRRVGIVLALSNEDEDEDEDEDEEEYIEKRK